MDRRCHRGRVRARAAVWPGLVFRGAAFPGCLGRAEAQQRHLRLGPLREQPRVLLVRVTEFMHPSSKSAQVDLKRCQPGLRFESQSLTRKSPLDESLGRGEGMICVLCACQEFHLQ